MFESKGIRAVILLAAIFCIGNVYGQGVTLNQTSITDLLGLNLKVKDVVWAQYFNNELYVLTKQKEVLRFEYTGQLTGRYPIIWPDRNLSFTASCFQIIDSNVCFLNNHGMLFTDKDFNSMYIRPFGYTNEQGDSALFVSVCTPNTLIDIQNDIIIHPAMAHYGIQPANKEYLYNCKACRTSGVLNLYRLSGHLKQLPREDPLYYDTCFATIGALPYEQQQKDLPHLWDMSFDIDAEKGYVLCSNAASYRIFGYSIKGARTISFGDEGKHLGPEDTLRSIPEDEYGVNNTIYRGYMKPLQCVTPVYEQLKYDAQSGYVYRVYSKPLKQMPPPDVETELPYQTQARMDYFLSTKERFLQVYNDSYELILDAPIPSCFQMLEVSNNHLTVLEAPDNNQNPKLARYVLVH